MIKAFNCVVFVRIHEFCYENGIRYGHAIHASFFNVDQDFVDGLAGERQSQNTLTVFMIDKSVCLELFLTGSQYWLYLTNKPMITYSQLQCTLSACNTATPQIHKQQHHAPTNRHRLSAIHIGLSFVPRYCAFFITE